MNKIKRANYCQEGHNAGLYYSTAFSRFGTVNNVELNLNNDTVSPINSTIVKPLIRKRFKTVVRWKPFKSLLASPSVKLGKFKMFKSVKSDEKFSSEQILAAFQAKLL